MAKNDNLKDFLTDVADAIREKKGTTDLINPQNFSEEILSIKSGGDAPYIPEKDVNFYDYDGTLLYSYTNQEAKALTEMPPLPSHDGLICQGWNYTLEELQRFSTRKTDIGALYITDDGSTRLYLNLAVDSLLDVPIYFRQSLDKGVRINWGDGTPTETLEGTGAMNARHSYESVGQYCISLFPIDGCVLGIGDTTQSGILGLYSSEESRIYCLYKVELGRSVRLEDYAFQYAPLETISVCEGLEYIGGVCFQGDVHSIKMFVSPKSYSITRTNSLAGNFHKIIWSPKDVSINTSSMRDALFHRIVIPDGWETVGNFMGVVYNLREIYFPKTINNLYNGVCQVSSTKILDFTMCESIPTAVGTHPFDGYFSENAEIRVPEDLYEEWRNATNWTVYADYIKPYPRLKLD